MFKMFFIYFLVVAMNNFVNPVTPEMLIDKGTFSGLNSFLMGIFSLAIFIALPIASKYINLNGVKKIMMFAPLLMALSQLIMFLSNRSLGLLIGRGLSGFFWAFFLLAGSVFVNNFSLPDKKVANFAYLVVASSLGGVVGQIFIGQLSTYFDGYFYAFALQIVLALMIIILAYFLIQEIKVKKIVQKKKKNSKYHQFYC